MTRNSHPLPPPAVLGHRGSLGQGQGAARPPTLEGPTPPGPGHESDEEGDHWGGGDGPLGGGAVRRDLRGAQVPRGVAGGADGHLETLCDGGESNGCMGSALSRKVIV